MSESHPPYGIRPRIDSPLAEHGAGCDPWTDIQAQVARLKDQARRQDERIEYVATLLRVQAEALARQDAALSALTQRIAALEQQENELGIRYEGRQS